MKIIEVYANFLPIVGGVQTHIYDICKCLLEKGDKPAVLTWGPSSPSFEIIHGIPVHRFWMPLPFRATRYPALFYLSSKIISLARKYDIDVIHAHNYFCGLASALAGKFLSKPVVVTFHIPMWFWPNRELPAHVSPVEPLLKRYFINSVSSIVCNSKFTYREMLKQDFPNSKLRIIYNWVSPLPRCNKANLKNVLERFNLANKRYILSVGRLVEREKGFSVLIRALRLLRDQEYDLDLVIVGEGPDKEMLRKCSFALGIEDRVHFLGSIVGRDLLCLYRECDVFALPSRFESFGLAQLEAISIGKPVVSTNVGGIPEIIENGQNGILVDSTPTAFASAIEKLMLTPHLERTFGEKSLEIVSEKFSIKNCYDTIALLKKL